MLPCHGRGRGFESRPVRLKFVITRTHVEFAGFLFSKVGGSVGEISLFNNNKRFMETSFPLLVCAAILFLARLFAKKVAVLLAESLFTKEKEEITAGFRTLTNRQSVIFTLEIETLAEFNEAISSWLWVEMSSRSANYATENLHLSQFFGNTQPYSVGGIFKTK
jgi:hypothetical protein